MSIPQDPTADLDVKTLAGSILVATFVNWGLLGVLFVQAYTYFIAFPRDRLMAKLLVYGILLCEIIQTLIISHDTLSVFAWSFGDRVKLNAMHTHWFTIPVSGGITGCIGQMFFAYRIFLISESSKKVPVTITIFSFASLCSAMVAAAQFFHAGTFTTLVGNDGGTLAGVGIWNGLGAVCDIIIALFMPYYILRKGTGLPATHAMVIKLMSLIIETGILTAIVAMAHLVLYFLSAYAFIVPGGTISKVYANTMVMILNNRIRIIGGRVEENSSHHSHRESKAFNGPTSTSRSRIQVSRDRLTFRLDDIQVRTDVQRRVDFDPVGQNSARLKEIGVVNQTQTQSDDLEVQHKRPSSPSNSQITPDPDHSVC